MLQELNISDMRNDPGKEFLKNFSVDWKRIANVRNGTFLSF